MFPRKSITKMPTPTFSLDLAKVDVGILVIDFQENIFMSSDRFQNLLNKFLYNLIRHPTLSNRARRVQDFWTRTRFIEYFWTRDPDPDPDPLLLHMLNFREISF
jgi:hypothetical protein